MEVIAAISAVAGLISFGKDVHEVLSNYSEAARNATLCVKILRNNIRDTISQLSQIRGLLEEEENFSKSGRGQRLFTPDSLQSTRGALEACDDIFSSLFEFISSRGKSFTFVRLHKVQEILQKPFDKAVILKKLDRIRWSLVQKEVDVYTTRLTEQKISLILVLSIARLRPIQSADTSNVLVRAGLHQEVKYDEKQVHRLEVLSRKRIRARRRWRHLYDAILLRQGGEDNLEGPPQEANFAQEGYPISSYRNRNSISDPSNMSQQARPHARRQRFHSDTLNLAGTDVERPSIRRFERANAAIGSAGGATPRWQESGRYQADELERPIGRVPTVLRRHDGRDEELEANDTTNFGESIDKDLTSQFDRPRPTATANDEHFAADINTTPEEDLIDLSNHVREAVNNTESNLSLIEKDFKMLAGTTTSTTESQTEPSAPCASPQPPISLFGINVSWDRIGSKTGLGAMSEPDSPNLQSLSDPMTLEAPSIVIPGVTCETITERLAQIQQERLSQESPKSKAKPPAKTSTQPDSHSIVNVFDFLEEVETPENDLAYTSQPNLASEDVHSVRRFIGTKNSFLSPKFSSNGAQSNPRKIGSKYDSAEDGSRVLGGNRSSIHRLLSRATSGLGWNSQPSSNSSPRSCDRCSSTDVIEAYVFNGTQLRRIPYSQADLLVLHKDLVSHNDWKKDFHSLKEADHNIIDEILKVQNHDGLVRTIAGIYCPKVGLLKSLLARVGKEYRKSSVQEPHLQHRVAQLLVFVVQNRSFSYDIAELKYRTSLSKTSSFTAPKPASIQTRTSTTLNNSMRSIHVFSSFKRYRDTANATYTAWLIQPWSLDGDWSHCTHTVAVCSQEELKSQCTKSSQDPSEIFAKLGRDQQLQIEELVNRVQNKCVDSQDDWNIVHLSIKTPRRSVGEENCESSIYIILEHGLSQELRELGGTHVQILPSDNATKDASKYVEEMPASSSINVNDVGLKSFDINSLRVSDAITQEASESQESPELKKCRELTESYLALEEVLESLKRDTRTVEHDRRNDPIKASTKTTFGARDAVLPQALYPPPLYAPVNPNLERSYHPSSGQGTQTFGSPTVDPTQQFQPFKPYTTFNPLNDYNIPHSFSPFTPLGEPDSYPYNLQQQMPEPDTERAMPYISRYRRNYNWPSYSAVDVTPPIVPDSSNFRGLNSPSDGFGPGPRNGVDTFGEAEASTYQANPFGASGLRRKYAAGTFKENESETYQANHDVKNMLLKWIPSETSQTGISPKSQQDRGNRMESDPRITSESFTTRTTDNSRSSRFASVLDEKDEERLYGI